jgi:hypothetical protein
MEKVAALRQLFAEYGYAPTGADDGMDKEAMNRLMKYLAQVGPKKFKSVWKKSLQRVYNSLHSELGKRVESMHNSGPSSKGAMAASVMLSTLRHKYDLKSYRASSRWEDLLNKARQDSAFRAAHRVELGAALREALKNNRILRRINKINGGPLQLIDNAANRYSALLHNRRFSPYRARLTDRGALRSKSLSKAEGIVSRLRGSKTAYMPRFPNAIMAARYMSGERSPESILRRHAPFVRAAMLPVRRSERTPEMIRRAGNTPFLSTMRESSGGLIDPDYLGWHGVSDPYGKRLGKSLFRGTDKFIAPDPAVSLPYAAALEGYRHTGMGNSYIPADMLAGEMQVKKNLDIDYNARAISGHTGDMLHQPVYGPHKAKASINASVERVREFQRSLSDYLKRDGREFNESGIHYLDWDEAPPNLRVDFSKFCSRNHPK